MWPTKRCDSTFLSKLLWQDRSLKMSCLWSWHQAVAKATQQPARQSTKAGPASATCCWQHELTWQRGQQLMDYFANFCDLFRGKKQHILPFKHVPALTIKQFETWGNWWTHRSFFASFWNTTQACQLKHVRTDFRPVASCKAEDAVCVRFCTKRRAPLGRLNLKG